MTALAVLLASLGLQVLAAALALRLTRVTAHQRAWVLIAGAITLMAGRRVVTLAQALGGERRQPDLETELLALAISVLMLSGVASIGPLFRAMARSEAALAESESRYRSVVASLAEGIIVRDHEGVVRACNASAERILGLPEDRILGRTRLFEPASLDSAGPPLPDESETALATLRSGRACAGLLTVMPRPRGGLTWLSVNTVALSKSGDAWPRSGVVSSLTDVTERKRADEVLWEIAEGLASLTGKAFFSSLVEYLGHSLGVSYVLLAEQVDGDAGARLRVVAVRGDGAIQEGAEYELESSPCEPCGVTPGTTTCVYPAGVRDRFPRNACLRDLQIEGFCGASLLGAGGQRLGVLLVMDRKRLDEPQRTEALVQLLGLRAAAELERSRAEAVVEQQRRFLREVIDGSPDAIFTRDAGGRLTLVNRAATRGFGPSVDALLGLREPDVDRLDDDVERRRREELELLSSGRDLLVPEERVLAADGSDRWLQTYKHPIVDPGGHARQLLVVVTDITERKRATEALRQAEEKYREIVEHAAEGIFQTTASGRLLTANRAFASMLGYDSVEEILAGTRDLRRVYVDPEDRRSLASRLEREAEARNFELHLKRRDGRTIWVSVNVRLVRDRPGRPEYLEGTLVDVTQRKATEKAEAQLQAAIQRAASEWQATFDAIGAPVVVVDHAGRIQRLNDAARDLAGLDFAACLNRPVGSLAAGEPWPSAALLIEPVASDRVTRSAQVCDPLSRKTWEVVASASQARGSQDGRVIVVAHDISATIDLQESLRRSETLSAMGSLVAGVAHQVRNPLFGIASTIEAFEARYGNKENFSSYLRVLRGELNRLTDLMKELLDYGRPPSRRLVREYVGPVVREGVRSCEASAQGAGIGLELALADPDVEVAMDRSRLVQVIQNLVENAIQHSRPGQSVAVASEVTEGEGPASLVLSVEDCGPGFASEDLSEAFKPFHTRRRGGTGLGLPIAQKIVEEHGGTLSAANRPGCGAALTVRLPLPRAAGGYGRQAS